MVSSAREDIMKKYKTAVTEDFITDYDLVKSLSQYSIIKRKAIMFALTSGILPEECEVLTWTDVSTMRLDKHSIHNLKSLPRHIFSDLVFWGSYQGSPIMISNLDEDCREVAHPYTWEQYVIMGKHIRPIIHSTDIFIREMAKQVLYQT